VGCCYYKFKPKEGQQFNLPIKATVVDDTNATATAIDSAISYGAKLVATKKYNKKLLSLLQANYDLNYTLISATKVKKQQPLSWLMANYRKWFCWLMIYLQIQHLNLLSQKYSS
jgi:hypothetical protein